MNKKELAEQILLKHIAYDCTASDIEIWKSLNSNERIWNGAIAAIIEAMSINSENVYTKNPCDENVNMSDTRNDA